MANKKNSNNSINYYGITKFCAFWAVIISGVIFLVNFIIQKLNGSFNGGILNTVATVLLIIAVIIPGWQYSKRWPVWVRVAFWVLAIVLLVFGSLSLSL